MLKTKIRKGVYETNSSSVHSICISKEPILNVKGRKVNFYLGEFGWEFESADPANYLYTAIMEQCDSDKLLSKLKAILDKNGIEYSFEPADYSHGYLENGGIDHSWETQEFIDAVLNNEDMLMRYLFGEETAVFTGNDNSDGFWRYETAYQGYEKAYDDDDNWIDNPYHNEEKFDYFVKEN